MDQWSGRDQTNGNESPIMDRMMHYELIAIIIGTLVAVAKHTGGKQYNGWLFLPSVDICCYHVMVVMHDSMNILSSSANEWKKYPFHAYAHHFSEKRSSTLNWSSFWSQRCTSTQIFSRRDRNNHSYVRQLTTDIRLYPSDFHECTSFIRSSLTMSGSDTSSMFKEESYWCCSNAPQLVSHQQE